MSGPKLVRHPAPQPAESTQGYLLRLIDENGYAGTTELFRVIGLRKDESIGSTSGLARLSAAACWPQGSISRRIMIGSGPDPKRLLLGHELLKSDVSRTPRKSLPRMRD